MFGSDGYLGDEGYSRQFDAMLESFAAPRAPSGKPERRYVAFSPIFGDAFENDPTNDGVERLVIVGRAPNGYDAGGGDAGEGGWPRGDMRDEAARSNVIEGLEKGSSKDWLDWAKRMTKRSAFWRTARDLLIGINTRIDVVDSWPRYLLWTNLYKIAPARRGNPNVVECRMQLDACKHLLELELNTWARVPVLVVAGTNGGTASKRFGVSAMPLVRTVSWSIRQQPMAEY